MTEETKDTLFIHRYSKSSEVSTDNVKLNVGPSLEILLNGSLWVSKDLPYQVNERPYYVSSDNPNQSGEYAFHTIVALPHELRKKLYGFVLTNERGRVRLRTMTPDTGEYILSLPKGRGYLLSSHAWIFGGRVDERGLLEELYLGEEMRKIIPEFDHPGLLARIVDDRGRII